MAEGAKPSAQTTEVKRRDPVSRGEQLDARQGDNSPAGAFLHLQQTAGNQAVARILESSLSTAHSGDERKKEEEEAEAIVDPSLSGPDELRTAKEPASAVSQKERTNQEPGLGEEQDAPDSPELEEAHLSRIATNSGSMFGARSDFSSSVGRASGWASRTGIGPPKPISWGILPAVNGPKRIGGFNAIGPPSGTGILSVQAVSGNAQGIGATQAPSAIIAPDFEFKTKNKPIRGRAKWYAKPTSKARSYAGDSISRFATAGLHKTANQEGGKDVYWDFSAAVSALDAAAEQEHCDDIIHAYDISLKEADDVLMAHVIGKKFGPKATKAEAEQLVLDAITNNLTHAGLGSDKTQWASIYDTLFTKTGTRDASGWHTFTPANRRTNAAGDVIYDVTDAGTKIGQVASATIIKY